MGAGFRRGARGGGCAPGTPPPGPAQGQYQDGASAAADAGDIPPALTNNVTDGSEPVNKALSEPGVPPAAAKELESLPETGGVPSASLLAVAPLVLLLPLVVAARFALRAPLSARR